MKIFLLLVLLHLNSLKASILPQNNLLLYSTGKSEGLTEQAYHEVIDRFESIFRQTLKKSGLDLQINRLWEDPTVNAGTFKRGKLIIINLYGGFARHRFVTSDGYSLVLCHELGHHLGGNPLKFFQDGRPGWPSVEGQADYFATLKCLRDLFKDSTYHLPEEIPLEVRTNCREAFNNEEARSICIRSALAGLSVAMVSTDVRRYQGPIGFDSSDPTIVNLTLESHPLPQCRLDTYFQGSICQVKSSIPLSPKDETIGSCHGKNGHVKGLRPLCWFKPSRK
jgi:hypothetical protein